jgi:hypothetical protein
VFILRWYWWRINAWSEISAMTAAAAISLTLQSRLGMPVVRMLHGIDSVLVVQPLDSDDPHGFAWLMLITTAATTLIWLGVTLATRPEPQVTLQNFYDRVRPAAMGWRRFAPDATRSETTLRWNFFHWVVASGMVYLMLFGFGNVIFGRTLEGTVMVAVGAALLGMLFWSLNRQGWSSFK